MRIQPKGMFQRFTDRARRVCYLAQEEAELLRHDYVGTEHLLLPLLYEQEGVAARTLQSLGISREEVRRQVEEITGHGQGSRTGPIPFTPPAKKALELSLREARPGKAGALREATAGAAVERRRPVAGPHRGEPATAP